MRKVVAMLLLLGMTHLCVAQTGPERGVEVLFLFNDPYGANTRLLENVFEDRGWNLTYAGLTETVSPCSALCTPLRMDLILPDVELLEFDVVALSTTRGAFHRTSEPGGALMKSEAVLGLLREADEIGLTLFASCASTLVLGEAGILEGHAISLHERFAAECEALGDGCTVSGPSAERSPIVDGHLVTGTSNRLYQREIAEAIESSLDGRRLAAQDQELQMRDVSVSVGELIADGVVSRALAIGGPGSDVARSICRVPSGYVVVGMTWSGSGARSDVLVVGLDETLGIKWSKACGGTGRDVGDGVCAAEGGGVIVVGSTTSAGSGAEDVLLLRLDEEGSLVWSRTIGGERADAGLDVCAAADGGYAACGYTYSEGDGESDVYLFRFDAAGELAWSKTFGGTSFERAAAIEALPDGGFALVGGTTNPLARGNYTGLLTRVDRSGDLLYEAFFGYSTYDFVEGLWATGDGGLILAGYRDMATDIMDAFIVRTDERGEQVWNLTHGERANLDYARDILETADDGFLVCGRTNHPVPGANDAWLLAVDSLGNVLWEQPFGGEGSDSVRRMVADDESRVVAVGYTTSFGAGSYDALILEIDPSLRK